MLSIALAFASLLASCVLLLLLSAFYTMMNVVVQKLGWSSALARSLIFLEDIPADFIREIGWIVVNALLYTTFVFLALFLFLQIGQDLCHMFSILFLSQRDESHSVSMMMQQNQVKSTFTLASFLFGFVAFALTEWIDCNRGRRNTDSVMIDVGSAEIVLLLCYLALTTVYVMFDFCSDFFNALPAERMSATRTVNSNVLEMDLDMEDNEDNYDSNSDRDSMQEMDVEPTTNIIIYSINEHRPVKSKSRIPHVVRRTSPLYWRHPLFSLEEYEAASSIRSPGRSFVPAGRALFPIPEGVHFLPDPVSQTHVVPRDRPNEIARGRRIVTSKIDSYCWSFLRVGRAWIHCLTELASTKLVGRRSNKIAQGHRMGTSEIDSPGSWSFLRAGRALVHFFTQRASTDVAVPLNGLDDIDQVSPLLAGMSGVSDIGVPVPMMVPFLEESQSSPLSESQCEIESPETSLCVAAHSVDDDDDVQGFMFNEDTEPQDINDVEDLPVDVAALVDYELPERTNTCSEEVPTDQVVAPLRRSARIAERRERLQLQSQESHNTILAPDVLGSIFVNGRRRSARHLKTIKSDDSTNITCSKRSQRARRSRS